MGCAESSFFSDGQPSLIHDDNKKLTESKIVVLGNSGVGKSSLSLRFCQGRFPQSHEVTIGAAFLQQTVRTTSGIQHKLHIWDTGGQERFRAMAPLYYRDAAGALIVFDCTDAGSFGSVSFWIDELTNKGPGNIVIFVVANKCDVSPALRAVSREEAASFCNSRSLVYFEASALSGEGVASLFQRLADQVYQFKQVK